MITYIQYPPKEADKEITGACLHAFTVLEWLMAPVMDFFYEQAEDAGTVAGKQEGVDLA